MHDETGRDDLRVPPPLRTFLEYGGDPATVLRNLAVLLDEARDAATASPSIRLERAEESRAMAAAIIEGLDVRESAASPTTDQELVTLKTWCADVNDDPSLYDLLVTTLGPEGRRAEAEAHDRHLRPHPLERVTPLERWWCSGCGASFEADTADAVEVGTRPGYSDWLDYPIRWCVDCVSAVARTFR